VGECRCMSMHVCVRCMGVWVRGWVGGWVEHRWRVAKMAGTFVLITMQWLLGFLFVCI